MTGRRRIRVTRRIILGFRDCHVLDHIVDNVHSKALAASNDAHTNGTRVRELHVHSPGELAGRIAHEGDHGTLDSLILRPSVHHGSVVHAIDQYFVNSSFLESVLILEVARNLHGRSRGCERPGQTDDEQVLVGGVLGRVDFLDRVETLVEFDGGDLVTRFDGGEGVDRRRRAERSYSHGKDSHGGFLRTTMVRRMRIKLMRGSCFLPSLWKR